MQREERSFRLGSVTIDGDLIAFESEQPLAFQAGRRDIVTVGIQYVYREASEDREVARIRLSAHVEGQPAQTQEAVIQDNPLMDDSRRGFLSVPIRIAGSGALRGRFSIEARYGAGPWRKPATLEVEGRHDGAFTLEID